MTVSVSRFKSCNSEIKIKSRRRQVRECSRPIDVRRFCVGCLKLRSSVSPSWRSFSFAWVAYLCSVSPTRTPKSKKEPGGRVSSVRCIGATETRSSGKTTGS
ncbi:hypothetical protein BDV12DRAFT_161006 [Aspergillus spectabilis]